MNRTRVTPVALLMGVVLASATMASLAMAQTVASVPARDHVDARTIDLLLARPVTVRLDGVTLKSAIEALVSSAGVHAAYRVEDLNDVKKPVTLHATRMPLGVALDSVLSGTHLQAQPMTSDVIKIAPAGDLPQQTGNIAGLVTDGKTKQPVRGASVTLDDSMRTTRTDDDGRYRIANVSVGTHRITIRAVGYGRQMARIVVAGTEPTVANVALSASVNTLDQVVVTATGEQRVRELGHVVARINADSLVKAAPISSVLDLLQSRVPGLQVLTGSGGVAGGDASLRLRGQTTASLNPEPIVIVDGVRFKTDNLVQTIGTIAQLQPDRRGLGETRSLLYDINPNDIETIEVVKGPSASTLYGPDASNGVIVITTKRGAPGKTEFKWYARPNINNTPKPAGSVRGYQAWGHDPATGNLFGANCTLVYQYDYHICVLDSITPAPVVADNPEYSVIGKDRPSWQYGASVGGGTQAIRYMLSANYNSQIGALQLSPHLEQALEAQLGRTTLSDAMRNPNTLRDIDGHANISADLGTKGNVTVSAGYTQTTHNRARISGYAYTQQQTIAPGTDTSRVNGLFDAAGFLISTQELSSRLNGAVNGTYRPWDWLTTTAVVGLDLAPSLTHEIQPPGSMGPYDQGFANDSRRSSVGRTMNLGATASAHPGALSFRTSLGVQYTYAHVDGLDAYGSQLAPGSTSIGTASSVSVGQVWTETASLGTYGEEVVGLHDRLFLTGSLRVDGSTAFGDAYHPTPYPKVGVSWIASDEPFLKDVPGLSELRFRYSFGAASRYPTSGMKLGVQYGGARLVDGTTQNTFYRTSLGNPSLRPERTREAEYGADATLFSLVNVGLTWYSRRTQDQLQYFQNASGLLRTWGNLGRIAAHGFEATANATLLNTSRARADLGFTYSHRVDKVLSLGDAQANYYGGFVVGYPTTAVFYHPILGVADTVGGGPDSIVFPEELIRDKVFRYRGVTAPPRTLTLTPSLGLFGGLLRLSTTFDRETGFVVENTWLDGCSYTGLCRAAFDRTAPIAEQIIAVSSESTDFLQSGDFTRWREFSATVQIPSRLLRLDAIHLHFSQASVSLQGRNLMLWTAYKGSDPESRDGFWNNDPIANGIPQTRTWSFRFDITP